MLGVDPDAVAKLFPALAAGKPGSPKKGNDEDFLEGLEWHLRNWMRRTGQKRGPALPAIAGGIYQALGEDQQIAAVSAEALADRWERKLRRVASTNVGPTHYNKVCCCRFFGLSTPSKGLTV
jgi:hypothetical protein